MKKLFTLLLASVLTLCSYGQSFTTGTKTAMLENNANFGATQVIAAPTGSLKRIRIYAIYLEINQSAGPANYSIVAGTGTNCADNQVKLTPAFTGKASGTQYYSPIFLPSTLDAPANNAVCVKFSASPNASNIQIIYKLEDAGV